MVTVWKTLSRFVESCLAARNTQRSLSLLPQHQGLTAVTVDFIQQRHALSLPQNPLNVRGHVRANVRGYAKGSCYGLDKPRLVSMGRANLEHVPSCDVLDVT